jgi:hypothetical protein
MIDSLLLKERQKVLNTKHLKSWYQRTKDAIVECVADVIVTIKSTLSNDATIKEEYEEAKKAKRGVWRTVVGWGKLTFQNLTRHGAFSETEFMYYG